MAVKRLQGQEARLGKSHDLLAQYADFMKDYLDQGHMEEATTDPPGASYLPHHAVVRTTALTTEITSSL